MKYEAALPSKKKWQGQLLVPLVFMKRKAIKVMKGVVLGARFGLPDRRIGKDHRTNSTHMNEGVFYSFQSA